MQHIFDGHNDLLLRLWMEKDHDAKLFLEGGPSTVNTKMNIAMGIGNEGHIDLKREREKGDLAVVFSLCSYLTRIWGSQHEVMGS